MIGSMLRRAALALTLTLLTTRASAENVKYTDDSVTKQYVEGIQSVPRQYRARAVPLCLSNDGSAAPPRGTVEPIGTASGKGGAIIRHAPDVRIAVNATVNGSAPAQLLLDSDVYRTKIKTRAAAAAGVPLACPADSA